MSTDTEKSSPELIDVRKHVEAQTQPFCIDMGETMNRILDQHGPIGGQIFLLELAYLIGMVCAHVFTPSEREHKKNAGSAPIQVEAIQNQILEGFNSALQSSNENSNR